MQPILLCLLVWPEAFASNIKLFGRRVFYPGEILARRNYLFIAVLLRTPAILMITVDRIKFLQPALITVTKTSPAVNFGRVY